MRNSGRVQCGSKKIPPNAQNMAFRQSLG